MRDERDYQAGRCEQDDRPGQQCRGGLSGLGVGARALPSGTWRPRLDSPAASVAGLPGRAVPPRPGCPARPARLRRRRASRPHLPRPGLVRRGPLSGAADPSAAAGRAPGGRSLPGRLPGRRSPPGPSPPGPSPPGGSARAVPQRAVLRPVGGRTGQDRHDRAGEGAAEDDVVDDVRHLVGGGVRGSEAVAADRVREDKLAAEAHHPRDHRDAADEGRGAPDSTARLAQRAGLGAPRPAARSRRCCGRRGSCLPGFRGRRVVAPRDRGGRNGPAAEHVEPPQGRGALDDGGEADHLAGRGEAGDHG